MTGFVEKPINPPKPMPNDPHHVLASMGNYVFERNALVNELILDAQFADSDHDFGKISFHECFHGAKSLCTIFRRIEFLGLSKKRWATGVT